jgi:hypothetical protein
MVGMRTKRASRLLVTVSMVAGLVVAAPEPAQAVLYFGPVADATIRADDPDGAFGLQTRLNVDNTPKKDVLLRFSVFGVGTGTITSARLRLHNTNASPLGGEFRRVVDNSWDERTVTWNTAPPGVDGPPVATLGAVTAGNAYTVDLSGSVVADGIYSFRLSTPSGNAAAYISDEGKTISQRPRLEIALDTTTPPPGVSFAAAGDHGANPTTDATLRSLDGSGVNFYLALGDLDYDQIATDQAWCDFVTARLPTLGPTFPFELVSGNHEDQDGPNGSILNHAACLPDRLDATVSPNGLYGTEYFFDYPATSPLVRVIMLAPSLTIEQRTYVYSAGNVRSLWVSETVDAARTAGIPWVVVGMHKNCISAGSKSCEIGRDLLNLLVDKKVDLVLQGHDHNYQRSKQLAVDPSDCPQIMINGFNSRCVVDDGSDDTYAKGAGTIIVINGAFGSRNLYPVNTTDSEAQYFAQLNADSWGFVRYALTADRLTARFVTSKGTFTDSFWIEGSL